jgi:nitrogen PTS system EIIA component
MKVEDLIAPEAVLVGVRAGDKRKLLEAVAERGGALAGLEPRTVLGALLRREELGSTGMGEGAAIPHARLPGIERPVGLFVCLKSAIDWEAIDDRPVDLVCLLLLPTTGRGSEPLSALACVARQLRSPEYLDKMRRAPDEGTLYGLLTGQGFHTNSRCQGESR